MNLKHLASLTLGLLLAVSVAAQTTPSDADVAAAKADATEAATSLKNLAATRDADGNVVYNADGTVATTTKSSTTTAGDLTYFKAMTGIDGLETVSSPSSSGQTGLVNVTTNASFDLTCGVDKAGAVRSAGLLAFKLVSCTGTPATTITFAVCDAPLKSSQCGTDATFNQTIAVPVGSFTTVSSQQVGAGCNSTNVCRITVKGTSSIGGSDSTIKTATAAAATSNSYVSDLSTPVTDGTLAAETTALGVPLQDCAAKNRASMAANGTVSGCDGSGNENTTVAVTTQAAATCTGTKTCSLYSDNTESFSRTCQRTFPLTEHTTHYVYDTQECKVVMRADDSNNSNLVEDDGCSDDATLSAKIKSMALIGQSSLACTEYTVDDSGNPTTTCKVQGYSRFYASVTATAQSTTDSPTAVSGACDSSSSSETTYVSYPATDGVWFGRTLTDTECTSVSSTDSTGVTTVSEQLTYKEKAGCGIFTAPSIGVACYGTATASDPADSCSNIDTSSCTMTAATPNSYAGNLVIGQDETYTCKQSSRVCLQWTSGTGDSSCLSTSSTTFGTDTVATTTTDTKALNAALVAAAIADSSSAGVDADSDPLVPKIFTGTDMRCTRATGGIGELFGRNCCRSDLERPITGNIIRDGCDMSAVELAAAKRSNYTVYLGDYCSRKTKFIHTCIERTQTYCSFNGLLPRIVQVQGRTQLAALTAASGGGQVHQTLAYNYMDTGTGSWSPALNVNGVEVHAWRWPSYCSDPKLAAQALTSSAAAFECPGIVHTVFAACDSSAGCGDIPAAPEYGAGLWSVIEVDPLVLKTTAISKYSVATGACAPGSGACSYDISSWPIGQGGKAIVTRDISFAAYSNEEPTSTSAGAVSQMASMDDLMFRTWSAAGVSDGKTVPATVRIDYSTDGGQSWATVQVPSSTKGSDYTFPNSDVTMSGQCDAAANLCSYRVTGSAIIVAKPWGSPQSPDCTGFTPGQLSALDFSTMDLSEWLASVLDTASTASSTAVAAAAAQEFASYNSLYTNTTSSTTVTTTSPTSVNFARISPDQGFGPFDTKLVVSGVWPQTTGDPTQDTDIVTAVWVDWGDCTSKEQLLKLNAAVTGSGYSGTHTFAAPNDLACGAASANVTQTVTMTVYTTKSGTQTRTVKVENAWATFPGGNPEHNSTIGVSTTTSVSGGNPLPPSP